MPEGNLYFCMLVNKLLHHDLLVWLFEDKDATDSAQEAVRKKLYKLMKQDKRIKAEEAEAASKRQQAGGRGRPRKKP